MDSSKYIYMYVNEYLYMYFSVCVRVCVNILTYMCADDTLAASDAGCGAEEGTGDGGGRWLVGFPSC